MTQDNENFPDGDIEITLNLSSDGYARLQTALKLTQEMTEQRVSSGEYLQAADRERMEVLRAIERQVRSQAMAQAGKFE